MCLVTMPTESKSATSLPADENNNISKKCQKTAVNGDIGEELPVKRDSIHRVTFHLPPLAEGNKEVGSIKVSTSNGAVPLADIPVHVNHQHYEQWARVPSRRPSQSILYRGIQQLKTNAGIRDDGVTVKTNEETVKNNRPTFQREKTFVPKIWNLRRDRSDVSHTGFSAESTFSRSLSKIRSPIKLNNAQLNNIVNVDKENLAKDHTLPRDVRVRNGFSRIRDRCSLPMSINEPHCIEDHVFLLNEHSKSYSSSRQNSKTNLRESDAKRERNFDCFARESREEKMSAHLQGKVEEGGFKAGDTTSSFRRAKTYIGDFPSRKSTAYRTPAYISSAELFDISQLTQFVQSSDEPRLLIRQRSDVPLRGSRPFLFKSHD